MRPPTLVLVPIIICGHTHLREAQRGSSPSRLGEPERNNAINSLGPIP